MATGTGGTLGGSSIYLKQQNPKVQCWLADSTGTGVKFVKVIIIFTFFFCDIFLRKMRKFNLKWKMMKKNQKKLVLL